MQSLFSTVGTLFTGTPAGKSKPPAMKPKSAPLHVKQKILRKQQKAKQQQAKDQQQPAQQTQSQILASVSPEKIEQLAAQMKAKTARTLPEEKSSKKLPTPEFVTRENGTVDFGATFEREIKTANEQAATEAAAVQAAINRRVQERFERNGRLTANEQAATEAAVQAAINRPVQKRFDRDGRLLGGSGSDQKNAYQALDEKDVETARKKYRLSETLKAIEEQITKSKLPAEQAVIYVKKIRENIAQQETEQGKQAAADAALFIALKLNAYRDCMWPFITALFNLFAPPEFNAMFFQNWQVWVNWAAQQVFSTIFVKALAPRTAREAVKQFGISPGQAEMYCKIFGDATLAAIIPWNVAQDVGQYIGQTYLGLDSNTAAVFSSWAPGIAEVITQGAVIDRRTKALDPTYEFNRSELLLSMSPIPGALPGNRWQVTFSLWMYFINILIQSSPVASLSTAWQVVIKLTLAILASLSVASDVRAENKWAAEVSNPAFRKLFGMEDAGEKTKQTLKQLQSALVELQKEIEVAKAAADIKIDVSRERDKTSGSALAANGGTAISPLPATSPSDGPAIGTNGSVNSKTDEEKTSLCPSCVIM
jgi:chemotaxis protein histidine kinase CheA